jgi:hypothetical protein
VLSRRVFLWAVVILLVMGAGEAWAWGPATHVKLAHDLLGQLSLLPGAVAGLLARYARDYVFGNVAADVVLAKRLSRVKQFCHHWETGFEILNDARTDQGRAFAFGYLSHLAADTIAHNRFVPRQMALTRSTMTFGHLYWELRADSTIGPYYWNELRSLLRWVADEHRQALSVQLTDTFLPFSLNWRLFHRMNRFVSMRGLRRTMDRWYTMSRWTLSDQMMREYRADCTERIIDVLTYQTESEVLNEDPNGNATLSYTKAQRRQLRQMARAGLIAPHILYEAAATHGPSGGCTYLVPHRHDRTW